jgi:hypothetical protein
VSRPTRSHAAVDPSGSGRGRVDFGWTTDPEAEATEAGRQHLGWLLSQAHGYLVRGLRGEPLGRIAALGYGADDRWPRTVTLRPPGVRGIWSRTTCELPFSQVLAVLPARREVRVLTALSADAPGSPASRVRSSRAPARRPAHPERGAMSGRAARLVGERAAEP